MNSITNNSLIRRISTIFLALLLIACNQTEMIEKFTSPSEQSIAKGYIDLLAQQRFEEIEKASDPSIISPTLRETLSKMASLLPNEKPLKVTLVGAHRNQLKDSSSINLTYEYHYPTNWLVINVAIKTVGNSSTIVGFNVVPQETSREEKNKFELIGKSALHYVVLVFSIVMPLFTLFVLIVCIKTRLKGRKWPWIIFILIGFGKFSINWSTGQFAYHTLMVQLLSASAFAPLYGSWTLAFSIPIGAIVFLIKRHTLRSDLENSGGLAIKD